MGADRRGRTPLAVARAAAVLGLSAVALSYAIPMALSWQPAANFLSPVIRAALVLLAVSLLWTTTSNADLARRLAMVVALLGGVAMLFGLATLGSESGFSRLGAGSTLARLLAMRPPPVIATGLAAIGMSLFLYRPGSERFDASAALASFACGLFFLTSVAHLYDARALTSPAGTAASTLVGALMLLLLSLAILNLHPAGPLAAYSGLDAGAVAKRRLLPAAVLTPIGSGYLMFFALDSQRISPTLAIAVTVFANVLVMLVLINAAGNRVSRVVWDRQRRMEAREAQVRKQGMRDALTQLLNRRGWDAELVDAEKRCRRDGSNACVLVIDLDGLKQINDSEGHKVGDAYIQRAAAALRKAARRGEPLARLGGDEFAYLVPDCDAEVASEIVDRFQDTLQKSRISASVGYALRNGTSLDQAFEKADAGMYQEKRERKRRRA